MFQIFIIIYLLADPLNRRRKKQRRSFKLKKKKKKTQAILRPSFTFQLKVLTSNVRAWKGLFSIEKLFL